MVYYFILWFWIIDAGRLHCQSTISDGVYQCHLSTTGEEERWLGRGCGMMVDGGDWGGDGSGGEGKMIQDEALSLNVGQFCKNPGMLGGFK